MYANIRPLIGNYKVMSFDTNTVFPNLSSYKTILVQETSFDAAVCRYLGATARGQIIAWLNTGTAQNKKSLIMVGGDLGYNYSRSGSGGRDLVWSETYGKFTYVSDNGATAQNATQGVTIDVGNVRQMTSSPPGGGYWPDGCNVVSGGSSTLYMYQGRTPTDPVAAIGNVQSGFVVASVFQDPRYYTGAFGPVIRAVIGWVQSNGGVITGVNNPNTTSLPNEFSLSQNYPNPFNPATKIKYSIPKSGLVTLKIYDILGKEVTTLINEVKNAGTYEAVFNGTNLSSGVYFYKLETTGFVDTKKMFLLK
ncbi:MAG: hypothetical protein CV087_11390 [Candidatus Brocadia sp. WS118]|nr:MAG: hypothetical protein CV087_11390 [Candidatus Brocadia sp. WS118]